jgi:hypothetical protein
MRSNLACALWLSVGLVALAAPAPAQNYDPDRVPSDVDAKQREACTPDVMRLCNDYIPDVSAIVGCLKREQLKLSPACGEVFGVAAAETTPAPPPKAAKTTAATKKSDAKAERKPAKPGAPLNLIDTAKAAK